MNDVTVLHSESATEIMPLEIRVKLCDDGGTASISFFERNRTRPGALRYGLDVEADTIDELIQALVPVLEAHITNWEFTWQRVPNPKHRPGE